MTLDDLIRLTEAEPGKYKLVLYQSDGRMCWVRRGECSLPLTPAPHEKQPSPEAAEG